MEDKCMIRKLSYFSVLLIALGGLAISCSDDSSRVTNPGEESDLDNHLSNDATLPGTATDIYGYISQGFYDPNGDTAVDDSLSQDTNDDSDDGYSDKPIDNGKGVY
jgi:hypothetical protein